MSGHVRRMFAAFKGRRQRVRDRSDTKPVHDCAIFIASSNKSFVELTLSINEMDKQIDKNRKKCPSSCTSLSCCFSGMGAKCHAT